MTLNFFEGLLENTFRPFLLVPKGHLVSILHFRHIFGQFGPFLNQYNEKKIEKIVKKVRKSSQSHDLTFFKFLKKSKSWLWLWLGDLPRKSDKTHEIDEINNLINQNENYLLLVRISLNENEDNDVSLFHKGATCLSKSVLAWPLPEFWLTNTKNGLLILFTSDRESNLLALAWARALSIFIWSSFKW